MQLYAVNFIPMLGSLYMFRVFYTPIIRITIYIIEYIRWKIKYLILLMHGATMKM